MSENEGWEQEGESHVINQKVRMFILFVWAAAWILPAPVYAADYVRLHTGYQGRVAPNVTTDVPYAEPLWSAEIDPQDAIAVGNGLVFYVQDGTIKAANPVTGETRWTFGKRVEQQIFYDGNELYAFETGGSLHQIDATTGKVIWTFDTGITDELYGLVLTFSEDQVYASLNGELFALDRNKGEAHWSAPSDWFLKFTLPLDDKVLVMTTESGAITVSVLYAYDAASGETLWRAMGVGSPLIIKEGLIYVQDTWPANDGYTHQYRLKVLDLDTGEEVREHAYLPIPEGADALVTQSYTDATDGEHLFIRSASDGHIYQYDYRQPGDEQQPTMYRNAQKWIAGPYDNKLFFEEEGGRGLRALKMTDHTSIHYEGVRDSISRLDVYNSAIFTGQANGELYVHHLMTGKAAFRYQTEGNEFYPFRVIQDVLIAQTEERLYAFQLPEDLLEQPTFRDYKETDATIVINGIEQDIAMNPVIMNNHVYVPLRALAEALGAAVEYDQGTKAVTVTYAGQTYSAPKGVVIQGSNYIPIRSFGDLIGVEVMWDGKNRTVIIEAKTDAV